MRKCQCLLFALKRSYICCYIICMTVPLMMKIRSPISTLHPNCHHEIIYANIDLNTNLPYERVVWNRPFETINMIVGKTITQFNWEKTFAHLNVNQIVFVFTETYLKKYIKHIYNKSNSILHEKIVCALLKNYHSKRKKYKNCKNNSYKNNSVLQQFQNLQSQLNFEILINLKLMKCVVLECLNHVVNPFENHYYVFLNLGYPKENSLEDIKRPIFFKFRKNEINKNYKIIGQVFITNIRKSS